MALVRKDGLIQVRLPKADADRFREWAENGSRSTASGVLRDWIYEAMDGPQNAPLEPSRPVSTTSKEVVKRPPKIPLTRAERRRVELALKKANKRGA